MSLLNEGVMGSLYATETKYQPPMDFLDHQLEINAGTRLAVVNWLVMVCDKEEFSDEAFFLAVNVMDRFLVREQVPRLELPLVALAAAFIAGKYTDLELPVCCLSLSLSLSLCVCVCVCVTCRPSFAGPTVAQVGSYAQFQGTCLASQYTMFCYCCNPQKQGPRTGSEGSGHLPAPFQFQTKICLGCSLDGSWSLSPRLLVLFVIAISIIFCVFVRVSECMCAKGAVIERQWRTCCTHGNR